MTATNHIQENLSKTILLGLGGSVLNSGGYRIRQGHTLGHFNVRTGCKYWITEVIDLDSIVLERFYCIQSPLYHVCLGEHSQLFTCQRSLGEDDFISFICLILDSFNHGITMGACILECHMFGNWFQPLEVHGQAGQKKNTQIAQNLNTPPILWSGRISS